MGSPEARTVYAMLFLKNLFTFCQKKFVGLINWFAVHPTSMNNTNHLISGDNKGKASQMFEKLMNGNDVMTGKVRVMCFETL